MIYGTDAIGMVGALPGKAFIPISTLPPTPDQEEILRIQADELFDERNLEDAAEMESVMSRIEIGNNPL